MYTVNEIARLGRLLNSYILYSVNKIARLGCLLNSYILYSVNEIRAFTELVHTVLCKRD